MRKALEDIVSALTVSPETALKVETYMSEELGIDWSEASGEEITKATTQAYEAILEEAKRLLAEYAFVDHVMA